MTRRIKGITREKERDLKKGRTAKAKERKDFSKGVKLMAPKPVWRLRT